jgi:hypothetical protein
MHDAKLLGEATGEPDTTAAIADSPGEPVDRLSVAGGGISPSESMGRMRHEAIPRHI